MSENVEFEFRIDALTPETLSMKRLAEYLKALAVVMGETDHVCFQRVEKGSALLKQQVIGHEAAERVGQRLRGIRSQQAPKEAVKAFHDINKLLLQDNAVGTLRPLTQGVAANSDLYFPGREEPEEPEIFVGEEYGHLDGILVQIGGRDTTVPVHLQFGTGPEGVYKCTASRSLALKLAHYLFKEVRVEGVGSWIRKPGGGWKCKAFQIEQFEELSTQSLSQSLRDARAALSDGLDGIGSPSEFFREMRKD
ncbi:hypothetical protein [Marinobacterium mangrovicola]|nr:hypothetical protein [Marinobacterium mangrovicola]